MPSARAVPIFIRIEPSGSAWLTLISPIDVVAMTPSTKSLARTLV